MRRKPLETQAAFNKTTAVRLHGWFKNAGLSMAYHRVLKLVFKAAWRVNMPDNHGVLPIWN